jgi:hypothetical protein
MTEPISTARTEFSVALDCTKNGCPEPHADDGWVSPFVESALEDILAKYGLEPKVNNHAATVVWRTVPAFVVYDGEDLARFQEEDAWDRVRQTPEWKIIYDNFRKHAASASDDGFDPMWEADEEWRRRDNARRRAQRSGGG